MRQNILHTFLMCLVLSSSACTNRSYVESSKNDARRIAGIGKHMVTYTSNGTAGETNVFGGCDCEKVSRHSYWMYNRLTATIPKIAGCASIGLINKSLNFRRSEKTKLFHLRTPRTPRRMIASVMHFFD